MPMVSFPATDFECFYASHFMLRGGSSPERPARMRIIMLTSHKIRSSRPAPQTQLFLQRTALLHSHPPRWTRSRLTGHVPTSTSNFCPRHTSSPRMPQSVQDAQDAAIQSFSCATRYKEGICYLPICKPGRHHHISTCWLAMFLVCQGMMPGPTLRKEGGETWGLLIWMHMDMNMR